MQYLSEEWFREADAALSAAWQAADGTDDVAPTRIGYEVTGTPQGRVSWVLHYGGDGAGLSPGDGDGELDATMALDYPTAVAIARGESSPQVAFMQGALKLGGDVMVLVERAAGVDVLGDALGALRDRTEF